MGKKAKASYLRPGPEKLLHKLLSTPEHHAKLKRKKNHTPENCPTQPPLFLNKSMVGP